MTTHGLGVLASIVVAMTFLIGCEEAGDREPQVTEPPSHLVPPTIRPVTPGPTEVVVTPGPTEAVVTPGPTEAVVTAGPDALPPELVGTWMQENWGGSTRTGYFTRKAYAFGANGTYQLLNLLCLTGGSCDYADPPEAGIAVVNGNQLSLSPQTQSIDGPRTYVFAVIRDPNMGDLRLQFQMADYIDEFFWQP